MQVLHETNCLPCPLQFFALVLTSHELVLNVRVIHLWIRRLFLIEFCTIYIWQIAHTSHARNARSLRSCILLFYILRCCTVLGLLFTLYTYVLIDTVLQTDYSKLRRQALATGKDTWHCSLAFPSTVTLLLHAPRIWTCRACCVPSHPHCLLLQPVLLSLAGRHCCGLPLSADCCIIDRPLIYFMVGGNGCSRLPGNLDVFIPGNTGMKKSGNPRHPGNGSPGMNSLLGNNIRENLQEMIETEL